MTRWQDEGMTGATPLSSCHLVIWVQPKFLAQLKLAADSSKSRPEAAVGPAIGRGD